MSETATERPTGGGGLDQFFGKKYGPLPGWAWAGIAAGGGYLYYRHKQNTSAASTTAASAGYTGQPFDYGPSVATLQSEVQTLQSGEAQENTTAPPTNTGSGPSTITPSTRPVVPSTFTGTPGQSPPVPAVTGKTASQAKSILANAGFNVGGGGTQPSFGNGIIRSQTPAAGSRIGYGSAYWPLGAGAPKVDIG